jgi:hypothetical protein
MWFEAVENWITFIWTSVVVDSISLSIYIIGMTDSGGYCGLRVGFESGSEIGCQTNAL